MIQYAVKIWKGCRLTPQSPLFESFVCILFNSVFDCIIILIKPYYTIEPSTFVLENKCNEKYEQNEDKRGNQSKFSENNDWRLWIFGQLLTLQLQIIDFNNNDQLIITCKV